MDTPLYTAYMKGSLKLTKLGEWWHDGAPFEHTKLISLFHRSIVWDEEENEYYVQIGKGRASFDCEDTAFFVSVLMDESDPWKVVLADETQEPLQTSTLRLGSEDQMYCTVKDTHRARFKRSAHQTLLQHAISDDSLLINGETVTLKRGC